VVGVFIKSQYQTENDMLFNPLLLMHAKRNEKLCANELRLLNYGRKVANLNIGFRENIKTKLGSMFFEYECKNVKVQIDFSDTESQTMKLLLRTNDDFNCDY
jgi:hypothetical protein